MRATVILLICVDSVEVVPSTRPVARIPKRKGASVTNDFGRKQRGFSLLLRLTLF